MDLERRVELVVRATEEVLTAAEVRSLFEREARPKAYIGFEPSGLLTIGHLVCVRKMRDLQAAGCELTVFLADWHAWINEKLGGDLDRIGRAGEYMRQAFIALGVDGDAARWRWAHELTGRSEYWARVLRVAKATSLARTKRAMTILGRSEEESHLDASKLFYPSMQAADIFELPVDLAYAGLDQRRAHVLAREVAHSYGWPLPVAVHTPLIPSLRGGGRMDPAAGSLERKMSKSDPKSAVVLPCSSEELSDRLKGAFCPAKEVEGNPIVAIARHILFPWGGTLQVPRPERFGGPIEFAEERKFLQAWQAGELHPADLKNAVSLALAPLIEPVAAHFRAHPEALERLRAVPSVSPPPKL
jgi:tyrosyl-tRNA synthetase